MPRPRLCPPKPGPQPCLSVLSSVSTIRNQRYHIHANLSFAVLVAQVLLLVSFHCQPGTVSSPVLLASLCCHGAGPFSCWLERFNSEFRYVPPESPAVVPPGRHRT